MSAPLSNRQKSYLSQLANRAFNRACAIARGQGQDLESVDKAAAAEKFRHTEVAKATGKLGLRCCSQDDYKLVEGHFLELLGNSGAAFNSQLKAATEPRRVIEFKITEACREFGFAISYANKICISQNHGNGLEAVGEKSLWNVFYTIRNRGLARKRDASPKKESQTETSNLALA